MLTRWRRCCYYVRQELSKRTFRRLSLQVIISSLGRDKAEAGLLKVDFDVSFPLPVCVSFCLFYARERERERERQSVCVCVNSL